MKKHIFLLIIFLFFISCSNYNQVDVTCSKAKRSLFEIAIPAFGELEAVTATPIQVPTNLRGSQKIAWLKPENSFVLKGTVLVKFDAESIKERIKEENYWSSTIDMDIKEKQGILEKEEKELNSDVKIIGLETKLAENYSYDDESLFSKNEIIESKSNLEFLSKKNELYKSKVQKQKQKAKAEIELLILKKQTHLLKLKQYKETLKSLELKAPHDGIFEYEKNWRGEKPKIGMNVWRGMKVGKLPDLSKMQAKIYILESEASGLKKDLEVTMSLDSNPEVNFLGKVISMDTIAKPLTRKSPLKYFQATVSLNKTIIKIMKPGKQLKAKIYVEKLENVISVPNQSLFVNKVDTYLYIKKGNKFKMEKVEIGSRSLTKTVITKGLNENDEYALTNPDEKENI